MKIKEFIWNNLIWLLLLVFCIIQLKFIHLDLWNDEIYTFKYFILRPYSTIITDYHAPNNHVLMNLFYKAYISLLNINNLTAVLESPGKLRLLQLIFSLLTILYFYKAASSYFNQNVALLSALVLITTIPYCNFSLQIRGYNLSAMFFMMIFYYLKKYIDNPRILYFIAIAILSACMMYTMPSNIYYIISFLLFPCILFTLRKSKISLFPHYKISVLASVFFVFVTGILLSFIFYYPVFDKVFSNSYVQYSPFSMINLKLFPFRVTRSFNSGRDILFVAAFLISATAIKKVIPFFQSLILLGCLYVVPFLLSFILGNSTPIRVFVILSPVYALIVGFVLFIVWEMIAKYKIKQEMFFGLLSILFLSNLYYQYKKVDQKLLSIIETTGNQSMTLVHNYFLAHFQPRKEIRQIQANTSFNQLPILIIGCEPHDMPHYLEAAHRDYYPDKTPLNSLMNIKDSILVTTSNPGSLIKNSLYHIKRISTENSYHTFFLVVRKK